MFHTGEPLEVRLKVRAQHPTDDFAFGIGLFNADGVCCYGTNTYVEEMNPERLSGDADVTFAIDSLDLVEGTYKLDLAVHKRDGFPYDYHRLLYTFRVKSRTQGRRHLSAAASLDVLTDGPVQESRIWSLGFRLSQRGPRAGVQSPKVRTAELCYTGSLSF